jgi:hypothetical protein
MLHPVPAGCTTTSCTVHDRHDALDHADRDEEVEEKEYQREEVAEEEEEDSFQAEFTTLSEFDEAVDKWFMETIGGKDQYCRLPPPLKEEEVAEEEEVEYCNRVDTGDQNEHQLIDVVPEKTELPTLHVLQRQLQGAKKAGRRMTASVRGVLRTLVVGVPLLLWTWCVTSVTGLCVRRRERRTVPAGASSTYTSGHDVDVPLAGAPRSSPVASRRPPRITSHHHDGDVAHDYDVLIGARDVVSTRRTASSSTSRSTMPSTSL